MTTEEISALVEAGAKIKTTRITKRERGAYADVLSRAIIDIAEVLLDDDDLEPALLGLLTFAREREYNLAGTDEQILSALRRMGRK